MKSQKIFLDFQTKHRLKKFPADEQDLQQGWNGAVKHIIRKMQCRNRYLEGNWQHEDIDILIEELKELQIK